VLTFKETTLNGAKVMVAFYGPINDYAFVWHGGAYIDVCILSATGTCELDGTFYQYGEQCINVYDYGDCTTTIRFGDEASFLGEIREWMRYERPYGRMA
jgi:hypothetical protein